MAKQTYRIKINQSFLKHQNVITESSRSKEHTICPVLVKASVLMGKAELSLLSDSRSGLRIWMWSEETLHPWPQWQNQGRACDPNQANENTSLNFFWKRGKPFLWRARQPECGPCWLPSLLLREADLRVDSHRPQLSQEMEDICSNILGTPGPSYALKLHLRLPIMLVLKTSLSKASCKCNTWLIIKPDALCSCNPLRLLP